MKSVMDKVIARIEGKSITATGGPMGASMSDLITAWRKDRQEIIEIIREEMEKAEEPVEDDAEDENGEDKWRRDLSCEYCREVYTFDLVCTHCGWVIGTPFVSGAVVFKDRLKGEA